MGTNSYTLVLTDGRFDQFIFEDTVVDNTTVPTGHGLVFTGRGVTNYGEAHNENLLHLIENFADVSSPPDPLVGQMWWDAGPGELKFFGGSGFQTADIDEHILSGSYPVVGDPGIVTVTKIISGAVQLISNAVETSTLSDHINTNVGDHDATAISFVPSGSIPGSAVNVQLAIEAVDANIDAHVADAVAAHAASAIEFVPFLSLTSINVQGAIEDANDERISIDAEISTSQTNINNHIVDPVDAHDADAISFIPAGGLTSTDVQAAIDEIATSAGTPGALETLRARPSGTQSIGTAFTQILFQTVLHGNAGAQCNAGTSVYTAAFDQEVNIIFTLQMILANNTFGELEIRNGGTVLRNHQTSNRDNSDDDSKVVITQYNEIGVKARLNSGNQIRFFAKIFPFNGIHATQSVVQSCQCEFEITRDLS